MINVSMTEQEFQDYLYQKIKHIMDFSFPEDQSAKIRELINKHYVLRQGLQVQGEMRVVLDYSMEGHNKISAVKLVRAAVDCGLKEALAFVKNETSDGFWERELGCGAVMTKPLPLAVATKLQQDLLAVGYKTSLIQ